MDYVAAISMWAHAHPFVLAGLAAASAHRRLIFRYAILWTLKTKYGRAILLGNADEILADIEDFKRELTEDIAEAKADDAKKAAATVPPAAP